MGLTCTECGASGVKLWRRYGIVASMAELKCRPCSEREQKTVMVGDQIGFRVPALPFDDTFFSYVGVANGYTTARQEAVSAWHALPETNP